MKTVLVSGHFDPFHDIHLAYIKQAMAYGGYLICVVSSDVQLLKKKGKVNIPEAGRTEIVDLILEGLHVPHETLWNDWDKETTLVAEALRALKPDIFFRGGDKTLDTMPSEEREVCDELGIRIRHAWLPYEAHSSTMIL